MLEITWDPAGRENHMLLHLPFGRHGARERGEGERVRNRAGGGGEGGKWRGVREKDGEE